VLLISITFNARSAQLLRQRSCTIYIHSSSTIASKASCDAKCQTLIVCRIGVTLVHHPTIERTRPQSLGGRFNDISPRSLHWSGPTHPSPITYKTLRILLWESLGVTDERGWVRLLSGFRVPADELWRPTSRSTFFFAISFPHCLAQSTGPDPTRKVRWGKIMSVRARAIGPLRRLSRTGGPIARPCFAPATTQTALRLLWYPQETGTAVTHRPRTPSTRIPLALGQPVGCLLSSTWASSVSFNQSRFSWSWGLK
jgi:hypothetical protein